MAIKWLSSGETGYVAIDSTTHRIRHFCESNSSLVYLWHTLQQHVFWALLPSTLLYDLYKTQPVTGPILLIWLVLVIFLCIYRAEDLLIYQPEQPEDARYNCQGLPDQHRDNLEGNKLLDSFEINWIQSSHAVLDSVLLLLPEELRKTRPTVLYFHGNAGSIGHRIFGGDVFHLYKNCLVNVLIFDYRGYGMSTGVPNEWGLKQDAESVLTWLRQRGDVIDTSKIVLFGRSLGGALAINLASKKSHVDDVCAVVVENTFTDIRGMCGELISKDLAEYVPDPLIRSKFGSSKDMEYVQQPIMFISGQQDTLVPPSMMEQLYETCNSPIKVMKRHRLGNHNNTWVCKGYHNAIANFLNEHVM